MRRLFARPAVVSWLMTLTLLSSQGGLLPYLNQARAQSIVGPSAAELQQASEQLERLFDALETAADEIPRETFDPRAIVETVGREPVELFEWVRDETHLVPYGGVLKGPTGVLMDRLGNSLDRALLLYELLRIAGHEVRLARSQLSLDETRELMELVRPMPDAETLLPAHSEAEVRGSIERYATEFGLDKDLLIQRLDLSQGAQQRLAEEIARRVEEQTAFVAEAVGLPAGNPEVEIREAQLTSLQDHWWVEQREGVSWVALDPTLPDSRPGQALSEAGETVQPVVLGDLGESLLHGIRIRVVVECLEEGRLTETVALESPFLIPAELFGARIALRHIPSNWPQDLDLLQEADPAERLRSVVLEQKQWFPLLSVGAADMADKNYSTSCEYGDAAQPDTGVLGVGRGVGNMLGGGIGGSEEQPQLTAEWIEYSIRVPGRSEEVVRRQVFDLLGPAARAQGGVRALELTEEQLLERSLALTSETEILPQVSRLSSHYIQHLLAQSLLANRELLLDLVRNSSLSPADLNERLLAVAPPPGPAVALARLRVGSSSSAEGSYFDRPNLLSYHRGMRRAPEGELRQFQAFDIVYNFLGTGQLADANSFLIRLRQGVLETNAEAYLAAQTCKSLNDLEPCVISGNVAETLAAAGDQRAGWQVFSNPDDPAWQRVELPRDVRARIEQDMVDGYTVVVPGGVSSSGEETSFGGWWRVDPSTGHTLGIGPDGWGQLTAEQKLVIARVATKGVLLAACLYVAGADAPTWRVTACVMSSILSGGAVVLGGFEGGIIALIADVFSLILIGRNTGLYEFPFE